MVAFSEAGHTCRWWRAPSPVNVNEPSGGGGDPIEARVDQLNIVDTIEVDVVKVTPSVPPSVAAKRKHNEEVGGTRLHKKLMAPFSLRALKQATGLMFGSSHPSSLLPRTPNPQSPTSIPMAT